MIPIFPEAMDPTDSRPYVLDFGVPSAGQAVAALVAGETLSAPVGVLDAASLSAGISIVSLALAPDGSGIADRAVAFRLAVADPTSVLFSGDGFTATVTVTADIPPVDKIERSARVIVRQR